MFAPKEPTECGCVVAGFERLGPSIVLSMKFWSSMTMESSLSWRPICD